MIQEADPAAAFESIFHPIAPRERVALSVEHEQPEPVLFYLGERIYFRPLERADELLLRRWINDPRNWRTLCHRRPVNAVREFEWIESLGKAAGDYVFGIALHDDDRLIGTTGLHRIDPRTRSATFGLLIGEVPYQNHGYGSEAVRLALRYGFRELNLNRIQLSVYANNWRAIRAYQKAGFKPEGCLRQAQYVNGEYVDEYRFAILREEWDALPSVTSSDRYQATRGRRSAEVA